ncbi:hypothetical protein ACKN8N_19420, partial [Bacillus velezensis]
MPGAATGALAIGGAVLRVGEEHGVFSVFRRTLIRNGLVTFLVLLGEYSGNSQYQDQCVLHYADCS